MTGDASLLYPRIIGDGIYSRVRVHGNIYQDAPKLDEDGRRALGYRLETHVWTHVNWISN